MATPLMMSNIPAVRILRQDKIQPTIAIASIAINQASLDGDIPPPWLLNWLTTALTISVVATATVENATIRAANMMRLKELILGGKVSYLLLRLS